MKKILLVLIVLKATQPCFSQGTLKITTGTTFKAKNGPHIVVNDMNLKNNATIQQATNDATFDFKGNTNDTISGTGNTIINTINLAKKAGSLLTLQRNISIVSQVIFAGGLLNLDNYIMDLSASGILSNENELSRAYTTGSGYIQATNNLNAPLLS